MNFINELYKDEIVCENLKKSIGALGIAASLLGTPNYQSLGAEPVAITSTVTKKDIDYDSLYNRISDSEGKGKPGRPGFKYNDSKGKPTIGIGHLITNKSKDTFIKLFKDKDLVDKMLSGETAMTDEQMKSLFKLDVEKKIATARKLIPNFDTYDQYVKEAIVDALYRGDLGRKTISYINKGEWNNAGIEYLKHDDYRDAVKNKGSKGIVKRMKKNQAAFLTYAKQIEKEKPKPKEEPKTKESKQSTSTNNNTYTIKAGDSLYSISKKYNTNIKNLTDANPGINPRQLKIGQKINLKPTSTSNNTYTIKSGDSLFKIAAKYNIKVSDIINKNPGIDPRKLKIGQKIKL